MRASVWYDEATLDRDVAEPASNRILATDVPSCRRPDTRTPSAQLQRGSLFSKLLEEGERLSVMVISGHVWITMENDTRDHVLTSLGSLEFVGPGLLVIEGLEQGARIRVAVPVCGEL